MSETRRAEQSEICLAQEWCRDGRGLWAVRNCISHEGHKSAHTFESWRYNVAPPQAAESERVLAALWEWAMIDPQFINGNDSKFQAAVKMKDQVRAILGRVTP